MTTNKDGLELVYGIVGTLDLLGSLLLFLAIAMVVMILLYFSIRLMLEEIKRYKKKRQEVHAEFKSDFDKLFAEKMNLPMPDLKKED